MKKSLLFNFFLTTILGLSLSEGFISIILPTMAAPTDTTLTKQFRRRSLLRFKVQNIQASRNREGGLARGSCSSSDMIAVLPQVASSKASLVPVELTTNAHPAFFVTVPNTSARQAVFLLRNEVGKVLFERTLSLNNINGIAYYTLPADFAGLEVGKKYRWRLSLVCDADDNSGNPRTGGWIEYRLPNSQLSKLLQTANARDKVTVYAENGYWHDTLKTIADLRMANPKDRTLVADWANVLSSVGLNNIANQPLISLTQ